MAEVRVLGAVSNGAVGTEVAVAERRVWDEGGRAPPVAPEIKENMIQLKNIQLIQYIRAPMQSTYDRIICPALTIASFRLITGVSKI